MPAKCFAEVETGLQHDSQDVDLGPGLINECARKQLHVEHIIKRQGQVGL